jgi:hypothetical protein
MNRLESALARFSTAVETLESTVKERLAGGRDPESALTEVSLLKFERERLVARIAALEEESRLLAGLTGEVEDRLDGAIAEIRDVLGRN